MEIGKVHYIEQGGAMENILKMTKDTVKLEGWGKVDHCSTFCFLVVWTCEVKNNYFMKNFDFVKRGAKLAAYRNGC